MTKTWIKLCGLSRRADIEAAVDWGVDAVGLVFYPRSSRAVTPSDVAGLLPQERGATRVVGLFVDPERSQVEAALETGGLDLLQFHGSESPAYCRSFGMPYLKAAGIPADWSQARVEKLFDDYSDAELVLLDAYDASEHGGTGRRFDWTQAAALPTELKARLVLAGGLSSGNVAEAIATVAPYGVDVSSGIESEKGLKDQAKMKQFLEGVRSA